MYVYEHKQWVWNDNPEPRYLKPTDIRWYKGLVSSHYLNNCVMCGKPNTAFIAYSKPHGKRVKLCWDCAKPKDDRVHNYTQTDDHFEFSRISSHA